MYNGLKFQQECQYHVFLDNYSQKPVVSTPALAVSHLAITQLYLECSMAISGTDWLEVPSIYKAYVRECPQKIWHYMVQYLQFRILRFPLKCMIVVRGDKPRSNHV